MPVSKLRKNRKAPVKKLSNRDRVNIYSAYQDKYSTYSEMELEDLIILRNSGTIKGTYLSALLEAIRVKELPAPEILADVAINS